MRLISLVDPRKKSSIFERIGALRKKFAQKYGFIIPLVRLRDNITLEPTAYEIRLYDHVIASGTLEPGRYLAMDPGTVQRPIKGIQTKERCMGCRRCGSVKPTGKRRYGRLYGDRSQSVLMTHLSETSAATLTNC